ncbi:radical SAM protein [Actinophytocola xanthii]|uniref:Radical SAM protein n=1 Tax=Actinophytocola xanthii TaxID=1912961 RepID=A0A1Q8CK44_9PSEU|nr:radical SAM protein [Actinophytocola xanthii]OLF14748.1 radical SAM protein [Actinophytocola xanthii]
MTTPDRPDYIVWDITYACPLRCEHCYSESGRRPTRQLDHDEILRVADRIIELAPAAVGMAGGEALVVRGVFDIIERIMDAGIEVLLYTGGWPLRPHMMADLLRLRPRVHVSVDGATAAVHDRIRGRAGSFDRAMAALRLLDEASEAARRDGGEPLEFGLDATIVRSSYDQLDLFCTDIAPRFPELGFLALSAVVPSGLANRAGFVEHEVLSDEQTASFTTAALRDRLRALTPADVELSTSDNKAMMMHPDQVANGSAFRGIAVEPDGAVRAMCIYEGVVGNLLADEPAELWQRARARWSDPFVADTLRPVRSMRQWAEAVRRIDYHFGTDSDRARIDRRPAFAAPVSV